MTYIGKQLGPYTLTRHIGSGGMAEVWTAERDRMGTRQTVAIKTLSASARQDPDHSRLFLSEAKLSLNLNHAAIIKVFDADEQDGDCFMAMEWVEGLNLAQLTAMLWEQGSSLPLHVSTYIISEVLRALEYAHTYAVAGAASIVHRDVSPQNVMLSVAGEVKLMDFGVARFATEETEGVRVRGKLRYMPPEQLRGESRDPRVDLFAVGAIFHELVEGRRFRKCLTESELLTTILEGRIPPLSPGNIIPSALEQVLFGLLCPDQNQRIPSARAARELLNQWSGFKTASMELESYVRRYHARNPELSGLTGEESLHSGSSASATPGTSRSTSTSGRALTVSAALRAGEGSGWIPRQGANRIAAPLFALLGLVIGVSSVNVALDTEQSQSVESGVAVQTPRQTPESLPPEPLPPEALPPEALPPEPLPPEPPPPDPLSAEPEAADADTGPTEPAEVESSPPLEPAPTVEPAPQAELPPPAADQQPTTKKPAVKKPKAKVKLSAGNFGTLVIKVGGRVHTVKTGKTVSVPLGSHRVEFRVRETAPWRPLGSITLTAGKKYTLTVSKPGRMAFASK